MRRRFLGGVHPVSYKESTRRKPIMPLEEPPKQVAIPLTMCTGGGAVPVVKPGDKVTVGQVIAKPEEGGVYVHSSVSGRVRAIEPRPHPWGGRWDAIVIDNDGQDTACPDLPEPMDWSRMDRAQVLERICQAGITSMGGGASPTHLRIARSVGRVDTLIVSAAECEPYLTADHRLLLEHGDQVLQSVQMLSQLLRADRAVLVVAGDKLNAVEFLERRLRRKRRSVELVTIETRYPLGMEKQLVRTITGREVPPGQSAVDVKCAVFNVATAYMGRAALLEGQPVTHRAVTVSGGAVARPRNLWVPIGTPLRCLLESAGGLKEEPAIILTGGPMTGTVQTDLEAPVVKNTNALLCLTKQEHGGADQPETVCVRCGHCVSSCPMNLNPAFVYRAMRMGERERLPQLHLEDCMECGCCSYICPSHIPLADLVRQARTILAEGGEQA